MGGPISRSRLADGDQPEEAGEIEAFELPKRRIGRDEPDGGMELTNRVGSVNEAIDTPIQIFGCNVRYGTSSKWGPDTWKDLERALLGPPMTLKALLDVVEQDGLVEQVAHRVERASAGGSNSAAVLRGAARSGRERSTTAWTQSQGSNEEAMPTYRPGSATVSQRLLAASSSVVLRSGTAPEDSQAPRPRRGASAAAAQH